MQTERKCKILKRSGQYAVVATTLVSFLSLFPGKALAQPAPTNGELFAYLKTSMKGIGDYMGYIGAAVSAVSYAEKLANFLGLVANSKDENLVLTYLSATYKAADQAQKTGWLAQAWTNYHNVKDPLSSNVQAIQNGTYTGWPALDTNATTAIYNTLSPGSMGVCERLPIFQVLAKIPDPQHPTSYEWRYGIEMAMLSVATRVTYWTAKNPDFRNNVTVQGELDDIRNCLIHHRDLIRTPLPSGPYCKLNGLCTTVTCKEQRSWPYWTISEESQPFSGTCAATNSAVGAQALIDVEAQYASKVDD